MHLFRRAAVRAISSPSSSFISKSRSINTSSPFALRAKTQQPISSAVFRRFNTNEAAATTIPSADGEEGSVKEAVESVSSPAYESAPRADRGYSDRRDDRRDDRPAGGFNRGPPAPVVPSTSIYVGNLVFDVTKADLEREFSTFGTIKNVIIASDSRGLSKGFGYVEFESQEQAAAAIEAKNQTVLDGRRIICNYQLRSQREARSPNPPSKTLFIGNLAFEMSDADLNKLFRDIRNVIDVRVAIDRRTGQPRGFAHADFVDVESAVKAREVLQGKDVYGRELRVDYSSASRGHATPRDSRM